MGLFNNTPRRKRSHGHRSYNKPIIHDVLFDTLLHYVKTPLGPHHIRTKPLKILDDLPEKAKESSCLDSSRPEYRLVLPLLITDSLVHHVLLMSVNSRNLAKFLHLKFDNKGIDAVNINNILNHRDVQSCIPPYFKMKFTPRITK
jgi:hypothetical protein